MYLVGYAAEFSGIKKVLQIENICYKMYTVTS
jgi:hypothetical protein